MIAEGIDKSIFGQALKGIILGILICFVIIIVSASISWYQNWRWEKEVCGEGGCQISQLSQSIDYCLEAKGTKLVMEKN